MTSLKTLLLALSIMTSISIAATANTENTGHSIEPVSSSEQFNVLDELNPFDPNIEQQLEELDRIYEEETGSSPYLGETWFDFDDLFRGGCYRATCKVWARVIKSEQKMYLYVNGNLEGVFDTSTGMKGHRTPDFDRHPNGRIYDRYTSKKWPGGDYKGMGNMPYAVFITGGFAIHGTGESNWPKLGQPASHGCIRIHPDNAYRFNRLVRQVGRKNVWITVE